MRTPAPAWLFHAPVVYSQRSIDVGILQRDSLDMDLTETLGACRDLHRRFPQLIEQESAYVAKHDIGLVVGDIPPLGFEVAARSSIPSVAISNFVWSWIYRAYVCHRPGFLPLIEEMERFYSTTTLALTLPYSCNMDVFPRQEPIPWIARTSNLTKAEARKAFELPQAAVIVLLSFGGFGMDRLPWNILRDLRDFFFVTTGKSKQIDGNVLILPNVQRHYEDLVRAVDVVVTKPGYGIVADAIAHQVAVLYTERGDFPEYPRLVEALNDCATATFIPQRELLSGNLAPYLTSLLQKERNWPAVPLAGATVGAEKIVTLLDRPR